MNEESQSQEALSRLAGGKKRVGVRIPCVAVLVPEPTNPFDSNAIAVEIGGLNVGYLSRAKAKAYQPVVQALAQQGQRGACEAAIKGGWRRSKDDEGNLGVDLALTSPKNALTDNNSG